MKTNLCVLSIISTIAILAISQTVNAQSDNFKTYTNKEMKFSIQHPSNWEVEDHEQDDLIPAYTTFSLPDSPQDGLSGSLSVVTEKIESYLDTDTMTLQNTSLQQHVQKELDDHLHSSSIKDVKIIRQNEVTVGGNPGWKIEYSTTGSDKPFGPYLYTAPNSYGFEIFTIANGEFYRLEYSEDPLEVPETLPLVNKMVESFQFNTE